MLDSLEAMRRLLDQFHSRPRSRAELARVYGQVWNKAELQAEFEVLEFIGESVEVRRKSDGQQGSLSYQDRPRIFFCFIPTLVLSGETTTLNSESDSPASPTPPFTP